MNDRQNLKNELQKVEAYLLNKKEIDEETILKLTNLSENHDISALIDNCLIRNEKKIKEILNENNFSVEDCIQILRMFLIKSKKLLTLSKQVEITKNIHNTIETAKPPIFWKDKEITKKQLELWTNKKISHLITRINLTELLIKKNSINSIQILLNFIFEETLIDTNNTFL
jgi:DNA polymerase-3 subunit delta